MCERVAKKLKIYKFVQYNGRHNNLLNFSMIFRQNNNYLCDKKIFFFKI